MTTVEIIAICSFVVAIIAIFVSLMIYGKSKSEHKTEKTEDHYSELSSRISSLEGKFEKLDLIHKDISELKGKNDKLDERLNMIEKKFIDLQHGLVNDIQILKSEAHVHPMGFVGRKLFR